MAKFEDRIFSLLNVKNAKITVCQQAENRLGTANVAAGAECERESQHCRS
jgi:hypothetical protein